jgi:hypothetical protein
VASTLLGSKKAVSSRLVCEGILGVWGALSGSLDSEDADPGVRPCKDEEAADVSVPPPLRVVPVVLLVLVVLVLLVTVGE